MRYTIASDVRFRRVLDEAVVLRQQAAEVLGLNLVGLRVLELAADGKSEGEMVELLGREFDTTDDELRHDVPEFLAVLIERGVLLPEGEGS